MYFFYNLQNDEIFVHYALSAKSTNYVQMSDCFQNNCGRCDKYQNHFIERML